MKINIQLDDHEVEEAMELLSQIRHLEDSIDELRLIIDDIRDLLDEQKAMPWSNPVVSSNSGCGW